MLRQNVLLFVMMGCFVLGHVGLTHGQQATSEAHDSDDVSDKPTSRQPVRLNTEHLPNVVRLHPKVISGGLPQGEEAFRELADLGVRTIISVDGMTPDARTASKFGLRYVHLPHGYNGIPQQRVRELAKAVRDLQGPIYIHCHHGEHRSPAAASVACVAAGLMPTSSALPVLRLAGTNRNYRGLYQAAEEATPIPVEQLDQLEVEFRQQVPIPPMAEAMVSIAHAHDHLRMIQNAGWSTPANHPDLSPAHEALILREHYTELLRTDEVKEQSVEFRNLLTAARDHVKELELALQNWQPSAQTSDQQLRMAKEQFSRMAATMEQDCKQCHLHHRDVPLAEPEYSSTASPSSR